MPLPDPLSQLLLQLVTILLMARVMGALMRRAGQPAVIGEMAAGILLGPSLLGWVSPPAFAFVFPESSLATLQLLSQIGVCLFLFVVGMDLDVSHLKDKASTAVIISQSSIVVPAALGAGMALLLFSAYAGTGATALTFMLFMIISMSITAFPVLARILDERKLSRTPLGAMALTCAAVNDVTAWSLLAGIVAIAQASEFTGSVLRLVEVIVFVAVMLWVVRPLLPRWIGSRATRPALLVWALILMLLSALTTDLIGIHALFGAFLAGAVIPRTD